MNTFRVLLLASLFGLVGAVSSCKKKEAETVAPDEKESTSSDQKPAGDDEEKKGESSAKLKKENMLKKELEGSDNLEVVVSRVELPKNSELPKHYHPGEEFVYMLEGSVLLNVDGEDEETLEKGDVGVVPREAHHFAKTQDESAKAIVFRVHESGEPVRYIIGEDGEEKPVEK